MKIEFIDDCREWYKRWSTWLSGLYATASAYALSQHDILFGVIDRLAEPLHTLSAIGLGCMLFVVPVLTVHIKQSNLAGSANGSA